MGNPAGGAIFGGSRLRDLYPTGAPPAPISEPTPTPPVVPPPGSTGGNGLISDIVSGNTGSNGSVPPTNAPPTSIAPIGNIPELGVGSVPPNTPPSSGFGGGPFHGEIGGFTGEGPGPWDNNLRVGLEMPTKTPPTSPVEGPISRIIGRRPPMGGMLPPFRRPEENPRFQLPRYQIGTPGFKGNPGFIGGIMQGPGAERMLPNPRLKARPRFGGRRGRVTNG